MSTNVGAPRPPHTIPPHRRTEVRRGDLEMLLADAGCDLVLRAVQLRPHIDQIHTLPTAGGGSVRGTVTAVAVDSAGIYVTVDGEQYPVPGGFDELCGGGGACASR